MAEGTIKAIMLKVSDAFLSGKDSVMLNGQKYDILEGAKPHEYYIGNDRVGAIGLRFFAENRKLSFFIV